MIRVLVWADSVIMQAGLEAIVDADPRFQTVPHSAQTRTVLTAARNGEPDVILLDGTELTHLRSGSATHRPLLAPPFVALAEMPTRGEIIRVLNSGARGILLRDSPPHEITSALQAVSDGLAVVSSEILDALVPTTHESPDEAMFPAEPLTLREAEVLASLAGGASNKEIAAKLHISEHTVKFHVSTILSKLGAATRAEAVARGYRQGLILI